MPHVLHATAITRRFGVIEALCGAELRAETGRVTGLIGPNGAGKSTLLACVAGLDEPDSGTVTMDGVPTGATRHATSVFLVPDGARPWVDQSVAQVLSFFAAVHGAPPALVAELHDALLLTALRTQRVGALSKGQGKRLLIALGLLTPHPFLLLDEPFDGLDLRQVRDVAALLRTHAERGRGLVLSIHQLTDAARTCDDLVLLDAGRTVAMGTLEDLRHRSGRPEGGIEEVFLALT
jgi:ABC-type multidrug transport system ATPase subunit